MSFHKSGERFVCLFVFWPNPTNFYYLAQISVKQKTGPPAETAGHRLAKTFSTLGSIVIHHISKNQCPSTYRSPKLRVLVVPNLK
jgi:hypothetical protein